MAHAHSVDPRDAWMLFVRQSDKGVNSKRRSRTKARRLKVSSLRYHPHQPPSTLVTEMPRKGSYMKPGSSKPGVRSLVPVIHPIPLGCQVLPSFSLMPRERHLPNMCLGIRVPSD